VKIHDDEAAQAAVEEEQVHAIPLVINAEAALASDEGEVAGPGLRAFAEHGGFVFGKQGAFVEEAADLPVELAHAPAAAQGFLFVKAAGFSSFTLRSFT
jgi:hypothetical protein